MCQLQPLFDKTEVFFLIQGLKMLQDENDAFRKVTINRLVPGDMNVPILLEYYDRRSAQLQSIQSKITALANSP